MNMGRPVKILLAVLTILPIVYMFFFIGFIFLTMGAAFSGKAPDQPAFDFFPMLFMMHFAVMLLCFALMAFYIVYLFKSDRVAQDKKALWAVVLFLGSFIAMPIFWYFYIWPDASTAAQGKQGAAANGR